MDEPSALKLGLWRGRLRNIGSNVRRAMPFALGVIAALLGLLLYNRLFPGPRPLTPQDVNQAVVQALASATPPPPFSALVYRKVQPSLVLIQTHAQGENGKTEGYLGSGFIIDNNGDILTSLHVVANATAIQLTFADGTQSDAQVITSQPENDIAVLSASQLPAQVVPATLGNPGAMHVGDDAYVVGNPFGLYSSMSAGVISGFNRSFQPLTSPHELTGLIQIDAAVNPGNSGGPLLNRNGDVIGIIVGIVNPTDQDVFIGIGFAVPINTAASAAGSPLY